MTVRVLVRLTEEEAAALDALVGSGEFRTRSDGLRAGLFQLLRDRREQEIDRAYARGYEEHPQHEWIGDAGLVQLAAFHRSEAGDPL